MLTLGWSNHVLCVCVCVAVVPNHVPSGYGQHRAGSEGGFVDRDPAAYPDVDNPDERPHHQPYFPRHGAGCQRYEKKNKTGLPRLLKYMLR